MHISYEGGILEDPWREPPKEMFLTTVAPEDAPDTPEFVEVEFKDGAPVSINGEVLPAHLLIQRANEIGGRNGVGRVDIVENRYVGIKSRGVYETPGVTILHGAHHAIESLTLDRETLRLRDSLVPKFSELVYNGYWYSPEMEHLLSFMKEIQVGVTGTARLKLFKGGIHIVGRKAPNSLYSEEYATFEEDTVYNQKDAEGFIKSMPCDSSYTTTERTVLWRVGILLWISGHCAQATSNKVSQIDRAPYCTQARSHLIAAPMRICLCPRRYAAGLCGRSTPPHAGGRP